MPQVTVHYTVPEGRYCWAKDECCPLFDNGNFENAPWCRLHEFYPDGETGDDGQFLGWVKCKTCLDFDPLAPWRR